jgi:HD superfamily phosphohydrolase
MSNTEKTKTLDERKPTLFEITKGIDLKPHKTIRIAVSGDVTLNKLEVGIIDTRDFQRLRSIKALGTTYLVYPTAIHTRFDHSLGALCTAMEMVRAIRDNKHNADEERRIKPEEEQLIRLYSLLHDIGHIPFGHTIEDEFCIFPRHDEDKDRIQRFLGEDSTIGKIIIKDLGKDFYKRFMSIYGADKKKLENLGEDLYIFDLVNNTVCADLLDYLRRDCYFCNIILDMDYRFLKYLYLRKDGEIKRVVVRLWKEGRPSPRRDILSELTRLLDNRYLLGERVYFHHAKLISGAMVAGAVQRLKGAGKLKKTDVYEIGDEMLLDKLENSKVDSVRRLVSRLRERNLWKRIPYERTRNDIDAEQAKLRDLDVMGAIMKRWWNDPIGRTDDEDSLAAAIGIDSGDLLIHCPDSRMAMKLAEMKVFWNGTLKPLKDCADDSVVGSKLSVILKSHESLWAIRAFLNPDCSDKEDTIVNAFQHLITFEPVAKSRYEKLYYQNIIQEVVRSENLATTMLYDEYEKKAQVAVKALISQTDTLRDRNIIRKIVKDAFTS